MRFRKTPPRYATRLTCVNRSRGFTLVEVCVCLAVIGLLLAILVPAVQSARESSRRATCQSHLHNLGLAMLAYEGTRGYLPPKINPPIEDYGGGRIGSRRKYAPHVHLLPFLDQASLAEKIDLSADQSDAVDPSVLPDYAQTLIALFQCPSDPRAGGNNYRFCTGSSPRGLHQTERATAGAFSRIGGVRMSEVTDGASHTAAASERCKSPGGNSAATPRDYYYANLPGIERPDADGMLQVCAAQTPENNPDFCPFVGAGWFQSGYTHTLYNHVAGPNSAIPDCNEAHKMSYSTFGVHKASSDHPGGVNLLLLDGSVRFVSQNIDLAVWRAAATFQGGEQVTQIE